MAKKESDNRTPYYVLRIIKQIRTKDLAKALDITDSSVSQIERGRVNPGKRTVRDYAKFFGVDRDFFERNKAQEGERFEDYLFRVLKDYLKK